MSVRHQLRVRRARPLHRLEVQCGAAPGAVATEAVSPRFWTLLGIGAVAGGVLFRTSVGRLALSTVRGFAVKVLVDRMTRFARGTRPTLTPALTPEARDLHALPSLADSRTSEPVVEVKAPHRPPAGIQGKRRPEARRTPRELSAEAT